MMNEPCGNENCLRCYPELKTFEVERERVERIVRSLEVRAVDEAAALAAFMKEATGPGSYMFDCAKGPLLEMHDPVVKRVEDHIARCYHDGVKHLAGCQIFVPKPVDDDDLLADDRRDCDCTLGEPWRQALIQRQAERAAAAAEAPVQNPASNLALDLTSCDFVADAGYSPLGPENLRQLGANLATAAALYRAWQLRDLDPAWHPGCHLDGAS